MVRLKESKNVAIRIIAKQNFNSSMVRLKVDGTFSFLILPDGFQFQYGAIKSIRHVRTLLRTFLFQFQYGAIKRFYELAAKYKSIYFNSSMVRLKE